MNLNKMLSIFFVVIIILNIKFYNCTAQATTYNFTTSATILEWIVPEDGIYNIELWGGSGGDGGRRYLRSKFRYRGEGGNYNNAIIWLATGDIVKYQIGPEGDYGEDGQWYGDRGGYGGNAPSNTWAGTGEDGEDGEGNEEYNGNSGAGGGGAGGGATRVEITRNSNVILDIRAGGGDGGDGENSYWKYIYGGDGGSGAYKTEGEISEHEGDGEIIITYIASPTLSQIHPQSNQIFGESDMSYVPQISVSDEKNSSLICKYYIDSETTPRDTKTVTDTSTAQTVTFNALNIGSLSEGNHTFRFEVSDGYQTVTKSVTIKVDKSPPTLGTVTVTPSTTALTISGSATDSIAGLHTTPYRYTVGSSTTSWLTSSTYTKSSLTPNTAYTVKFKARDVKGHVSTHTENKYTKAQVPSIAVSDPTSYTLDVSLSDNNPTSTQYQIKTGTKYVKQDGSLTATATWITVPEKQITVTGLSPNTSYSFKARAKNGDGAVTSYSSSVSRTTLVAPPAAPAISNTVSTNNSIAVYWNTVQGAASYNVLADGQLIQNVTSPYTHTGLGAGTSHTYKVRAKNAGGTSIWSSAVNAWTITSPPSNITAASTETDITLSWNSVTGATGYAILINGNEEINAGTATTYTHSNLIPNTAHTYKVKSICSAGESSYSTQISKTTKAKVPNGGSIGDITKNSIQAAWTGNLNPEGTYYALGIFDTNEILISQNSWTTGLQDIAAGLNPETTYKVKVKAKNNEGVETSWYEIGTVTTLPAPPEAPQNISAQEDETQITILWENVEGATGYDIIKDGTQIDDAISPYTDTGLTPGTEHTYKIRAKNSGGTSGWSTEITSATRLNIPASLTATATNSSITVKWNEIGGATGYQIEKDGQIIETQITNTEYTDTQLASLTPHTYRIKAKNNVSESLWSDSISKITKTQLPIVPDNIETQCTANEITVTWNSVEGATGYDIKADGRTINTGTNTRYRDTGLEDGTQHTYQVRARNAAGKSNWSLAETADTTQLSPDVPVNLSASMTDTDIQVTWDEVDDSLGYEIEIDNNEPLTVSQAVYNHTNLNPGTKHYYKVRTEKESGYSNWSTLLTASTLTEAGEVPGIPENIETNAAQNSIILSWDRVNGAQSYDIEKDGEIIDNVKTDIFECGGLESATSYTFRIRAKNANGTGSWSEEAIMSTSAEVSAIPSIPQNLEASASGIAISLIWDYMDNADSYDIEINNETVDNIFMSGYVYDNGEYNTTYTFRVRGINENGAGSWSEPITSTTMPQAPEIPQNITAEATEENITLIWDEVSGAQMYEIEADGQTISNITQTSYTDTNLYSGTQHTYKVRAKNSGGTSDWSMEITILTETGTTGIPQNISIQSQEKSITLTWDEITDAQSYEIEIDGEDITSTVENSFTHNNLLSGTQHIYRIRAIRSGQTGAWSGQIEKATLLNAPSIIVATPDKNQINISWEPVTGATGYEIEIDGETVNSITEENYLHENITPGSGHTYRIRARNSISTSNWSEEISINAISYGYPIECKNGEIFDIVIAGSSITDLYSYSFNIIYDNEKIELVDLSSITPEDETETVTIEGTDIEIVEISEGLIKIKVNKPIAPGQTWSGFVNSIKFRSKVENQIDVEYSIVKED